MFKKQLIPLVVIVAILAAVLILKQWRQPPPSIEEQLALKRLAPFGFLVSDADRIEIYRGGNEDNKVALTREDDQWYVESKFNAPGKKNTIEEFLDKMKTLEGEFRSDEASVISDYALEEDKALHITVRRKNEEKAGYHLIIGKKETYGRSFVRRSGENTVYTINVNLASEVGIWSEGKSPEADRWMNKTALDLDKEKIVKIALKTPDRFCVFEKREEEKKAEKEAETKEEDNPETEKKMKWTLVGGGLDDTFKQTGLDAILRSLDSMTAVDVADPEKKKDFGLDNPGYRCEATLEDGEKTILVGGRKEQGGTPYVMVHGRETIYKLSDWTFKGVFKDGKDLFNLKGLNEKEDKVNSIALKYPSARIRLAKTGKEWTISSPQTGLKFKESAVGDIAKALAGWSPIDYTDETDLKALGLAKPEMTATFKVADGKSHTIAVGAEASGAKGRYVLLDDNERVWVASSDDIEKIFPSITGFFELEVANIASKDITKVQVEREDSSFALTRNGKDEWVLTVGKKKLEADKSKVDEFLKRFSVVTASDIALDRKSLSKDLHAKVRVDMVKKKRFSIQFEAEKDGRRAARVSGKSAILLFSKTVADGLAPPIEDLEKAPEKPKEEAEEAKTEEPAP